MTSIRLCSLALATLLLSAATLYAHGGGSHGGGFDSGYSAPVRAPAHADDGDSAGAPSLWPFGRKPNESPEQVAQEIGELEERRDDARAASRAAEVRQLEAKLGVARLRHDIAELRQERDSFIRDGSKGDARRLDAKIHAVKGKLRVAQADLGASGAEPRGER